MTTLEQLLREACMLKAAGDLRGLRDVIDDLKPYNIDAERFYALLELAPRTMTKQTFVSKGRPRAACEAPLGSFDNPRPYTREAFDASLKPRRLAKGG